MPGLSAQERAMLILRSWKEAMPEDFALLLLDLNEESLGVSAR